MIARRLAFGSAALLMALSLALPLAAPPVVGVVLSPAALTMTLVAAVLFALAGAGAPAWAGGSHKCNGKSAVLAMRPAVMSAAAVTVA
mgnify:CR=1 FL=1